MDAVVCAVLLLTGILMGGLLIFGGIVIGYRMGIKTVRKDQTPLFDGAFTPVSDTSETTV